MSGTSRTRGVTRLGRFIRGRRPDRNPLRRASDLMETGAAALLVLLFAVAAPFAARASGTWMRAISHQTQLAQRASWHRVPAVVLKSEPGPDAFGGGVPLEPMASVRWTAPDGKKVTGEIPVPSGTAPGATVTVWTTRDGQVADPPLEDSQVASRVLLTEVVSVAGLALGTVIIGALARRELNRRRMAAWDEDWRVTEPRWTTRA